MKQHFWDKDLGEMAASAYGWIVNYWKEQVLPLFMGFSIFFILAIPLLIMLGILWYLNKIQWAPEHGAYKIGLDNSCKACVMSASSTSSGEVRMAAHSVLAAPPRAIRSAIV